jgi:hypothetical protein
MPSSILKSLKVPSSKVTLHYTVLQMHMGASVQGRLIHSLPEKTVPVEERKVEGIGLVKE